MYCLAVLIAEAPSRIISKYTCLNVCWELQLCLKQKAMPSGRPGNNYSAQLLLDQQGTWKILMIVISA